MKVPDKEISLICDDCFQTNTFEAHNLPPKITCLRKGCGKPLQDELDRYARLHPDKIWAGDLPPFHLADENNLQLEDEDLTPFP